MKSACEAATRVLPGAAVIELSGEVDGSAAMVLTTAYHQAVSAYADLRTVVLDFAAVDYINSTPWCAACCRPSPPRSPASVTSCEARRAA